MSMPSVEVLENRIAPAGVITGSFKDGILSLLGNQGDNAVQINAQGTPGGFVVVSDNGDVLKINGKTGTTLAFEGLLKGVRARMGEGNDNIYLYSLLTLNDINLEMGNGDNAAALANVSASGAICYSGGDGMDFLDNNSGILHAGSITFNGGSGPSQFSLTGYRIEVDGALNFQGGTDWDRVTVGNLGAGEMNIGGKLTLNLGEGDNDVFMGGQTFTAQDGVKITGGNGRDSVIADCGTAVIGDDIQISLGNSGESGPDFLTFRLGHAKVDGALNVTMGNATSPAPGLLRGWAGNQIAFTDGTVTDGVSIQTGNGDHSFELNSSGPLTLGPVTVKTGRGNDSVRFSLNNATVGLVSLQLGEGDNSFEMTPNELSLQNGRDLVQSSNHIQMAGLTYTSGSGADTFLIGNELFQSPLEVTQGIKINTAAGISMVGIQTPSYLGGAIQITGGAGDDQVNLALGSANVNGAILVQAGAGNNTLKMSGSIITADSLGYTTGAGNDSFTLNCTDLKLTGQLQLLLGEGSNDGTINAANLVKAGSFMLRSGGGEDGFSIEAGVMETTGMFSVNLGGANNLFGVSTGSLKVAGPLGITTKAGNDTISLTSTNLQSGALTINTGDGADGVAVHVQESAHVFGQLTLVGGNHEEQFSPTEIVAGILNVDAGISASYGDGMNSFLLEGGYSIDAKGIIQVNFSGDGADTAQIQAGMQISANELNFHAGQGGLTAFLGALPAGSDTNLEVNTLRFIGGVGSDSFSTLTGTGVVHKGMNVSMGDGYNSLQVNITEIEMNSSLLVEGGLLVSSKTTIRPEARGGGDMVSLANLVTGGSVTIEMGDANSRVDLTSCIFPRLGIHLGGGDDSLQMMVGPQPMEIRGLAKILGEGGDDSIHIGAGVAFKGGAIYDGGEGYNTLNDPLAVYEPGQPQLSNIFRNIPT